MNLGIREQNIEVTQYTSNSQVFVHKSRFSITSYLFVFILAAVLYILTCSPGIEWQDSGLIQYRVLHNDIEGKLGLALSHPLYYFIVLPFKYIKVFNFAYRINCASAILSAFAIANLFLLLKLWLHETYPALLGAATLALSNTFWQHSTMPETYGLMVALLLLELVMLLQYARTSQNSYLFLLAFVNGLAIANHMLASISFICYFVFVMILLVKGQVKFRHIVIIALFWMVGAIPYESLIVDNIIKTQDVKGTFESALFGLNWKNAVLNTSLSWQTVKENFLYILLNFPTPNILFVFVGLWCIYQISPKRWYATMLIVLSILYFAFAFRYAVQDRYAFFIPFYCMISIFIGVGVYRYMIKGSGAYKLLFALFCLVVIPAYIKAPDIAEALEVQVGSNRKISYRNDREYFLYPWKMDYKGRLYAEGAEQFALNALFPVKTPAIVYADSTTAPPLLLVQELRKFRKNEDIKIISSIGSTEDSPLFNEHNIDELLSERNVYVISNIIGYCPDFLLDSSKYKFTLEDNIWKVEKNK